MSSGHQGLVPRSRQCEQLQVDGVGAEVAPSAAKSLARARSLTALASIDHGWMPPLEPREMDKKLSFDFLLDFMVSPVT